MFMGPFQIILVFGIVLAIPFLAALFLARAGQWIAVICAFAIIIGLGVWLFLQTNGVLTPVLDQTSAVYMVIFLILPACVAAVIGTLIGWILHRRRSAV